MIRDGGRREVEARLLVSGDVLVLTEGERVPADARLFEGALEVDMSALTGESMPVFRTATRRSGERGLLERSDLVFSGTSCTGGEALPR